MLTNLDARYEPKTVSSHISKMSKPVGTRYSFVLDDISAHVDSMAACIEQLRNMRKTLDDTLASSMLVASLDVPELAPVATSIKTWKDDSLPWENIANCFIEEVMILTTGLSPVGI